MFTGLVEDVGRIKTLRKGDSSLVVTVATKLSPGSMKLGASVAVNGACLTVVKKRREDFTVEVSPETLHCTNMKQLQVGDLVNLERPMRLGGELGGHLVTGHVDAVGTVGAIAPKGEFIIFSFRVPAKIGALLVAKGSVAVDGISLTVNRCGPRSFSVAIVPFTLRHTNLRVRRVGDKVNLETDLIGKYVYKMLGR